MLPKRRPRLSVAVAEICVIMACAKPVNGDVPEARAVRALQLTGDSTNGPKEWMLSSVVRWKGEEYAIEDGVQILLGVLRNPEPNEERWNRATALSELANLGTQIKGHPCLDELLLRFDTFGKLEKKIALTCLMGSKDPRGLPLFARILDEEKDIKLRFSAARALAFWNIRRGVAELVDLLDSNEEMPPPSQLLYVRDHAMQTFRLMNIRKGWGFPDDKESAKAPPDVIPPPDVAARLKPPPTATEIKKWWSENEHRFPDWKPGDPLPEVEADQQNPVEGNDK